MPRITVGGSGRLHSGGKISQEIQEFNRANHNLSKKIRATVAPGVITPIYRKRVKPGDTFDIEDIEIALYTDPTEKAMYGHYTAYIEFFYSPTRLKQAWLHTNKEYIGEDMSSVKLPIFDAKFNGIRWDITEQPDIQQINPSSLLSYMGFRSAGQNIHGYSTDTPEVRVIKNSEKIIDYYDIVKNYYSNRQEKNFWIIDYAGGITTKKVNLIGQHVQEAKGWGTKIEPPTPSIDGNPPSNLVPDVVNQENIGDWNMWLDIRGENLSVPNPLKIIVTYIPLGSEDEINITLNGIPNMIRSDDQMRVIGYTINLNETEKNLFKNTIKRYRGINVEDTASSIGAKLLQVPITNCDDMREDILARVKETTAFTINEETYAPYGQLFKKMKKKGNNKTRS